MDTNVLLISVLAIFVILVLMVGLVWIVRYRQHPQQQSEFVSASEPIKNIETNPTALTTEDGLVFNGMSGYSLASGQGGQQSEANAALMSYPLIASHAGSTKNVAVLNAIRVSKQQMANQRQKLEQQLAMTQTLKHPHCAKVLGSNVRTGTPYFVEEWLGTGSLQDFLTTGETLAGNDLTNLVGELCDALAFLHSRNIVHGTVDAAHIRFDEQNSPHLIHCGFSRLVTTDVSQAAADGISEMTPWNDLFMLGRLSYQLASGKTTETKADSADGNELRKLNPALSPPLAEAIQKAVHPDPMKRFKSARDMARAFGFTRQFHGLQDATSVFILSPDEVESVRRPLIRRLAPAGPLRLLNTATDDILTLSLPRTIITRDLVNPRDTMISRTNGEFVFDGNAWRLGELANLNSANGIFINDKSLVTPKVLHVGDAIRVGRTTLVVQG